MKKTILALATLGVLAFGTDYSAMSATELAAMRGTVAPEDRPAFQAAMQEKMQALSPHERAAAMNQAPENSPGQKNMGGIASGEGASGKSGTSGGASSGGSGKGGGNGKGGRN